MKKIYSVIILLAFVLPQSFFGQCSLYPVSLSSKVANSNLIIEGKVLSQRSFWNTDRNYIYTSNLVNVNQVFKGAVYTSAVEIITEGGLVDMNKQVVDPSLQLNIGDEGVFILNTFNQPSQFGNPVYQVYADQQGFYKFDIKENAATVPFKNYNTINSVYGEFELALGTDLPGFSDPNSANRFTSSVSSIAAITGISPTTITAGTFSVLTITGSGFGATQGTSIVEFKNADDGGATYIQPDVTQYVSWNNTQIQVMVPTKSGTIGTAGTGPIRVTVGSSTVSTQTLTVNYGELNVLYTNTITTQSVFNTRHIGLNGMNGVTWQMYTSFDANATAKASFLRAFQTWRCNTNINWLLGTTVTTNTIAADGVDVIRFDIGSELPAGVLGRCTSYFNGCPAAGPTLNWYVSELDICFDDPATSAITWNFGPANATGSQYDFESVAVHELGHGHQLSHVINNSDVMHYSIANAVNKRTLIAANINGGMDVMSRSTAASICAKPNMVPITASLCAAGSPTPAFSLVTPACVGQVIAVNSSTTSGATNFSWTMTGGSTTSSTLMNTSTSYAAPGVYTITLLATNGVGSTSVNHTISIVAVPNVSVTSANICSGNNATLTASGATSYTWNPGALTGASQILSPATTQVYTVLGSNGTCTNTSTGTINVTTSPTVSVPNAVICSGGSTLITATGATNYTFNPGSLIGASQTLNPSGTLVYTVTGANGSCLNSKSFTITVNPTPTVNVPNAVICSGSSTLITASGATSYTWNPGSLTGTSQNLNPVTTTTYTVTGATGGCSVNKSFTLTVNPTPTISVPNPTICSGTSTLVTATGAASYTWNPGALTGSSQTYSPATTSTYTITGVTGPCSSTNSFTLTVNSTPTVSTVASVTLICTGQTTTLTVSGASSYTFNPGAITGNSISVSPTASTTYTVDGQSNGCSGTSLVTVSVSLCTGITKTGNSADLKIYPNPTEGIVNLNFGEEFTGQVTLFNALGQLLISQKIIASDNTTLDLSVYPKGVYTAKLNPLNGKGIVIRIVRD